MPQPLLDTSALIGLALLVALNAVFVAAEFAIVTVRWTRVDELVDKGVFGATAVKAAIEDINGTIAACQLGITFTSLGLGWIGEPAIAHLLVPLFARLPHPIDEVFVHGAAIALAFLVITYLHTVLGEQVPKAIALQRAEQIALLLGGPLLLFGRLFRPFIAFINVSSGFFVRVMRLPPARVEEQVHTLEELDMLVEESEEAGLMDTDQAAYVRNLFELSDKTVRDAMVPREKVVTLSLAASEAEVLETARETAHTRMPVWEHTPDNIVGIVNTKDLFHLFSLRGLVILMDAMYPALFVAPDLPVARLLADLPAREAPDGGGARRRPSLPRHRDARGHPRGDRGRDRGRARRAAPHRGGLHPAHPARAARRRAARDAGAPRDPRAPADRDPPTAARPRRRLVGLTAAARSTRASAGRDPPAVGAPPRAAAAAFPRPPAGAPNCR